MTVLYVDTAARTLAGPLGTIACTIGRNGTCAVADKHEGDSRTPTGTWPLRTVLLRPDRIEPPLGLALPWRWIAPDDGWSDDPADPAYNRPVRHPHPFSAERLWREDGGYDIVIVLGHNDAPPVPARGSAIFLHCMTASAVTEGCIALASSDIRRLLPLLAGGDLVTVA